jgi:hypothetical protein
MPFPKPLSNANPWIYVEKTKRKKKECEKIRCFLKIGMSNFHGLNQWQMNM